MGNAMGPTVTYTGDVISSALNVTNSYNDAERILREEFNLHSGVIQAIYAVDNPNNDPTGPGTMTLYDVLITHADGTTELLSRCLALQPLFGGAINNYMEVLPPDPGPQALDGSVDPTDKRATRVLVGSISGQKMSGVILGTLPHPNKVAVADRPSQSQGTFMGTEFQGLNFKVGNDGSLTITFNGPKDDSGNLINANGPTTLSIDASGNIAFSTNNSQSVNVNRVSGQVTVTNGGTSILMDQNGNQTTINCDSANINTTKDTTITAMGKATVIATDDTTVSSNTMIKLAKGQATPSEPFVLGNQLMLFLQQFMTVMLAHTHEIVLPVPGTPTSPMDPGSTATLTQLQSSPVADNSLLSKHILGTKG